MKKGFTLMELMVVVLIIGILASIGVPYYYKTMETSKATDAVSIASLIANANKMYQIDNNSYLSGQITDSCNTQSCSSAWGVCRLVACNYVAKHPWSNSDYDFFACNGSTGGGYCSGGADPAVASARRKSIGCRYPYCNWGYIITASGSCQPVNGAPPCPRI